MRYNIIPPQKLQATITLPASKSISNRALIIHALAKDNGPLAEPPSQPQNLSDCDDTDVLVAAFRDMPYEINIKAAGTAMRFMTAYLSVTEGEHVITGTERMKHRPIAILVDSLRALGADIEYVGEEGFPPLKISGRRLDGGLLQVPGNISSQYISALLMIGPTFRDGLTLQLTGTIISRPYINMTLSMMRQFGAEADWSGDDTIVVKPVRYGPVAYYVESDWSASSYWYEMMLLTTDADAEIRLTGLYEQSLQGDSVVREIFASLGVGTQFEESADGLSAVVLSKQGRAVEHFEYDFSACPDLAQTIVCACCGMGITFDFTGLSTLKIKETDRIEALKVELRKLGYVLHDKNDNELLWDGERCTPSSEPIDTYEDHRMAMAFAPLAMRLSGVKINNPEVVSKSYPNYWRDLKLCGYSL